MDDTGIKMRRVIWKENSSADSTVVLEPGSPSIEKTNKEKKKKKQSLQLKSWMGKTAAPKTHQEFCFFTWLLQRLSSRMAKPKIPARI